MKVFLDCPENLVRTSQDMIRVFYPEVEFMTVPEGAGFCVRLALAEKAGLLALAGELKLNAAWQEADPAGQNADKAKLRTGRWPDQTEFRSGYSWPLVLPGEERHNAAKRVAKLLVKDLLEQATGRSAGPWGILTGVRPTKIVHRLLDLGINGDRLEALLAKAYALNPAKNFLLREVAQIQRGFFHPQAWAGRFVSIYIGIPFCPTRCAYCSFPAYSLGRYSSWVEPFVQALIQEIRAVGEAVRDHKLTLETIYIGGGTPTSLPTSQLRLILAAVNRWLKTPDTIEYTVEAGRPDTINLEILGLLRDHGVTRLSINPQSMNSRTLRAIGRNHTPEEVVRAVELARRTGFRNLNMDLIVGLPGEGPEELANTLTQIRPLAPENLTVHTLALKRASELNAVLKGWQPPPDRLSELREPQGGAGRLEPTAESEPAFAGRLEPTAEPGPALTGPLEPTAEPGPALTGSLEPTAPCGLAFAGPAQIAGLLQQTYQTARDLGMLPYYLYRQKYMLGHLENVGFAKPGYECVYNIQMMEERQTVIGLGGGASSKWVRSADWYLEATYNPKEPKNYFERIEEIVAKKVSRIQAFVKGLGGAGDAEV